MVSHTTLVFMRYTIPEWLRRNSKDKKCLANCSLIFCDDNQDMDITTVVESLMSLFIEQVKQYQQM